jgi:hypothetical protein
MGDTDVPQHQKEDVFIDTLLGIEDWMDSEEGEAMLDTEAQMIEDVFPTLSESLTSLIELYTIMIARSSGEDGMGVEVEPIDTNEFVYSLLVNTSLIFVENPTLLGSSHSKDRNTRKINEMKARTQITDSIMGLMKDILPAEDVIRKYIKKVCGSKEKKPEKEAQSESDPSSEPGDAPKPKRVELPAEEDMVLETKDVLPVSIKIRKDVWDKVEKENPVDE